MDHFAGLDVSVKDTPPAPAPIVTPSRAATRLPRRRAA